MRRIIEWYLGIAPAGSGEAMHWSLTWGGGSVVGTALVLCSAIVLVVFLSRQHAGRRSNRWLSLLALRLLVLAIVGIWLGALTLQVTRTGLPTLVLMIDTSASMALEDDVRTGSSAAHKADHDRRSGRLSLAKRLLLQDDAVLLQELSHNYRLQVYEFADEARLIGQTSTAADLAALLQSVADLTADGSETRPGPCLDEVLAQYRGAPPAAAVVLTDGIASLNPGERLSSARQPSAQGVPVFAIPTGSGAPALDLEIYDLQVDPIVFVGDTVSVEVTTRGVGLGGREAAFQLQQMHQSAPLDRTTLTLRNDGQPDTARLSFTPEYEGDYELVVVAEPLSQERNRDNNLLQRRIQVRQGRLKVLLVERAPRWEYRHLKAVLERDPNIELRTVLQESDLAHQQEDRTALGSFPATRDDLFAFDALILGDIDLQYLNPGALTLIRDFVATRGGGLILIAGDRHNPVSFQGTPLEVLIPVQISDASQRQSSHEFQVMPANPGLDHPLLRIGNQSRTAEFWRKLPNLTWSVGAQLREPAGIAVAVRDDDERGAVIALQRFGAGQVLFHATDELWRWRRRIEDRYYGRYWRQAVRFVCRAERLGNAGALELTTDRSKYQQGESVQFRLRSSDPEKLRTDEGVPTLSVERNSGEPQVVVLAETPGGAGEFVGALPVAVSGAYQARLISPFVEGAVPECQFEVELPRRELQQQAAEIADLQQVAQRTQGAMLAYDEVATLPTRLPRGEATAVLNTESVPVWARGEWLILFVALLAVEWLLRRHD